MDSSLNSLGWLHCINLLLTVLLIENFCLKFKKSGQVCQDSDHDDDEVCDVASPYWYVPDKFYYCVTFPSVQCSKYSAEVTWNGLMDALHFQKDIFNFRFYLIFHHIFFNNL